jgi:hypothetical protein
MQADLPNSRQVSSTLLFVTRLIRARSPITTPSDLARIKALAQLPTLKKHLVLLPLLQKQPIAQWSNGLPMFA